MTDADVHHAEMPTPDDLDEHAVEAFLTGRSVAAGEVGSLAVFADDLRVAVSGPPPVPTPQLATLLTEGFSFDEHAPAAAAARASVADRLPVGHQRQRRRKMTIGGFLAALAAKLSGLGVAAKVALGAVLATASAATAGAANVLPDPAQQAVARVVNATPFNIADGSDGDRDAPALPGVGDPGRPPVGDTAGTTDDAADGDDGAVEAGTHGACVSEVAREAPRGAGGVHGQAVSAAAKACPKATEPDDAASPTTATTLPSDEGTTDVTSPGNGNRGQSNGNSGHGNGNGNGNGNSGPGGGNSAPGNGNPGGRGR